MSVLLSLTNALIPSLYLKPLTVSSWFGVIVVFPYSWSLPALHSAFQQGSAWCYLYLNFFHFFLDGLYCWFLLAKTINIPRSTWAFSSPLSFFLASLIFTRDHSTFHLSVWNEYSAPFISLFNFMKMIWIIRWIIIIKMIDNINKNDINDNMNNLKY